MTTKKKTKDSQTSKVEDQNETTPPSPEETSTASSTPSPAETKEIKVIERIFETREVAPSDVFGKLNRSQINLIKQTVAKGASDEELQLFLQVCKGANLNPFMKQVHLVPRWDSKTGQEVRTIQVGIDGFRAVAESSNAYAGNDDPIFEGDKTIEYTTGSGDKAKKKTLTVPEKATVKVYKLMQGQKMEFTATARWEEYYPGAKMGFQWHIRPYLMLGKCAEALALRKAFPKLLSGMYAAEELDRTASADTDAKKKQTGKEKLLQMIDQADLPALTDYKGKIEVSDKYSEEEKEQLFFMIDQRIETLKKEV